MISIVPINLTDQARKSKRLLQRISPRHRPHPLNPRRPEPLHLLVSVSLHKFNLLHNQTAIKAAVKPIQSEIQGGREATALSLNIMDGSDTTALDEAELADREPQGGIHPESSEDIRCERLLSSVSNYDFAVFFNGDRRQSGVSFRRKLLRSP